MDIIEKIKVQAIKLQKAFNNVRVGIYPSDFGRFNQNMKYYLDSLNITGIYLADATFNSQGYPTFTDMRLFLKNIDVCLIWGRDNLCIDMADYIGRHGNRVELIDLLDRSENFALIHSENEFQIIDYDNLTEKQISIVHDSNIDLICVKKTVDEDLQWETAWRNQIDFIPFDLQLLDNNAAMAYCPECGSVCYTDRSFVVTGNYFGGVVFYLFHCHYDFFVLKKWENLMGIYLPDKEIFIKFRKMRMHFSRPDPDHNYTALIDQFKTYVVYFIEEAIDYLKNDSPKKLQFIVGYQNNLGHHLCNELSAIQRFIDSGDTDIIQSPLLLEHDFYDFKGLFPEILDIDLGRPGADTKRLHTDIFRNSLQQNRLSLFLYTFGQLSNTLAEKLISRSKQKYERKIQQLERFLNAKDSWPILWITIRAGRRRKWINQKEALSYVLNQLYVNYPHIAAVFDGIATAEEYYQQIKLLLNKKIKTYNALHLSLEDTIWWVTSADAFISPIGTGNAFIFLANIPGVFHTNSKFLKEHKFSERNINYYFAPRENWKPCVILPAENEDLSEPDPRLRNYEIDRDALYEMVRKVLGYIERTKTDTEIGHERFENYSA
ncbi:hypothetical protein D1AOALGA4SA_9708 [Olavius algarvensis Delta 1 endosymbiont]|nr:hypothetical protein D1AOALGA4SA_9708 [Olavius algarvensis Delta 1 endosymbiont]